MYVENWDQLYRKIAEDLSLKRAKDEYATDIMERIMEGRKQVEMELLSQTLKGKIAFVFGAGPSLKPDVKRFAEYYKARINTAIVAADGAAECLMYEGIRPDLIVTDLDGNVRYIDEASKRGSLLIVHAHGDNIPQLETYVRFFKGEVIATTQVNERKHVHNFGGFTDGDRAAIISARFGASSVVLAGMDFGEKVGKYSKPHLAEDIKADERKAKKLRWGKKLIELLIEKEGNRVKFFNATRFGEEIRGCKRIEFNEIRGIEIE